MCGNLKFLSYTEGFGVQSPPLYYYWFVLHIDFEVT